MKVWNYIYKIKLLEIDELKIKNWVAVDEEEAKRNTQINL